MDEFEIISKYIKSQNSSPIVMGKGDDCSVVDWSESTYLLESTDCLVEDVHFRLKDFSFKDLAYKCLAVNISDISAMGGTPKRVHLSLAIPSSLKESQIKEFFESFYETAEPLGIRLVGGDLSSSPKSLFVNIHISGEVGKNNIKWRKGLGEEGVLCVTGPLGGSAAGLESLNQNMDNKFVQIHKRPPIELEKAQWLSLQSGVQGMMDLSDGLLSDLQRLKSGSFRIVLESLPLDPELQPLGKKLKVDPLQWALCGGEDYRLLFNCKSLQVGTLQARYKALFAEEFYVIGDVESSTQPLVHLSKGGSPFSAPWMPFKHF